MSRLNLREATTCLEYLNLKVVLVNSLRQKMFLIPSENTMWIMRPFVIGSSTWASAVSV